MKWGIRGGKNGRMRGCRRGLEFLPGGAEQGGTGAVWADSGCSSGEPAWKKRGDGAGRAASEGEDARGQNGAAEGECGAAGLRAAARRAEHCAEGAADGADDLGGGAIFSEDDHASGDADTGGCAYAGVCRGDFQDRTPVSGLAAGESARRDLADFAGECAADCLSGDRCAVPGGLGGRPECGAGIDGAESALFGAGAMAGRPGGDAGGAASIAGSWSGADSGVNAGRSGRMLPRGVAEGRRDFFLGGWSGGIGRRRWMQAA